MANSRLDASIRLFRGDKSVNLALDDLEVGLHVYSNVLICTPKAHAFAVPPPPGAGYRYS